MFDRLARQVEQAVGSPWASLAALVVILIWIACGPIFDWSDSYQLIINTGTTIITFLMVFLIQATQSLDTRALHLKLDELIRVSAARNELINVEEAGREEIDRLRDEISGP